MRGWEAQLPPSFPIDHVRDDALREATRRRALRRRRNYRAVSAICVVILTATGVVVTARDRDRRQIEAGPSPSATTGGSGPGQRVPADAVTTEARANGMIAFVRTTGPQDPAPKLYVMNEDGSGQTMIAETTRGVNLTWSPDGTKLAFEDIGGIYTVNADGTGETRVPGTASGDQSPSWSPDGTRLAVRRFEAMTAGIDVVNVDGSGRHRVITGDAGWPAWSPDGNRIAYSSGLELYVVNSDGSGRKRLTATGGYDDAPTWSPDGRKIAFRHNDSISVVEVGSGDVRPLASPGGTALANPAGQGANKLAAGGGSPATPRWSPDGKKIVYALYHTGDRCSIWVMNADGSGQAALTDSPTCDRDPAWQPRPA